MPIFKQLFGLRSKLPEFNVWTVSCMVLLAALVVLALPGFTVSLLGQAVAWPGVDLSLVGLSPVLGNFQRGADIYPAQQVKILASGYDPTAPELFTQDQQLLRRRLDAAGLSSLNLVSVSEQDQRYLLLQSGNNLTADQLSRLASLLSGQGNIEIWQHSDAAPEDQRALLLASYLDGYNPVPAAVQLDQIVGLGIEPRSSLGTDVLRVTLSPTGLEIYKQIQATDASNKPLVVVIDDQPAMFLADASQAQDASIILAVPLFSEMSSSELGLVAGYLLGSSGLNHTYATETPTPVPAYYAQGGRTLIALSFITGLVLVMLWWTKIWNTKQQISAIIALGISVSMIVVIYKVVATPLSAVFMIVFAIFAVVTSWLIYSINTSQSAILQLKLVRETVFVAFLVCGLIYLGGQLFGYLQEAVGLTAIGLFSLWFSIWLSWTYLLVTRLERD